MSSDSTMPDELDGPLFDNLPFLVQPQNVARYEDGRVLILDRRAYPFTKRFVTCETFEQVAQAITDMVTQSGGPSYAAAYGMVLAARSVRNATATVRLETLQRAAEVLGNARPTNRGIWHAATELLDVGTTAVRNDVDLEEHMLAAARRRFARDYSLARRRGEHAAGLLRDGATFLSHCWPDIALVYTGLVALEQGKNVSAMCSETRPYLQGARLTADAMVGIGLPTTVITDGMQAHAMSQGKVDVVLTGADRVTMAGHVINKVGTLQAALAARQFDVPFYSFTRGPDWQAPTAHDVQIEERAPNEVLHCLGTRIATNGVDGYYPAFDVTPPELVTGLITKDGVLDPTELVDRYPVPAGARP